MNIPSKIEIFSVFLSKLMKIVKNITFLFSYFQPITMTLHGNIITFFILNKMCY